MCPSFLWTRSINTIEHLLNIFFTRSSPCITHEEVFLEQNCRNPSLGLATKARGCKGAGQEGHPGVTSHAPRSAKSVRE